MWTIIKLDKKKIKLFENELEKKIGNNFMIYNPKIMIQCDSPVPMKSDLC